jgi:hypothetical protein
MYGALEVHKLVKMVQIKRSSEYFYEKSFRFYRPIKVPQINSEKRFCIQERFFLWDNPSP